MWAPRWPSHGRTPAGRRAHGLGARGRQLQEQCPELVGPTHRVSAMQRMQKWTSAMCAALYPVAQEENLTPTAHGADSSWEPSHPGSWQSLDQGEGATQCAGLGSPGVLSPASRGKNSARISLQGTWTFTHSHVGLQNLPEGLPHAQGHRLEMLPAHSLLVKGLLKRHTEKQNADPVKQPHRPSLTGSRTLGPPSMPPSQTEGLTS